MYQIPWKLTTILTRREITLSLISLMTDNQTLRSKAKTERELLKWIPKSLAFEFVNFIYIGQSKLALFIAFYSWTQEGQDPEPRAVSDPRKKNLGFSHLILTSAWIFSISCCRSEFCDERVQQLKASMSPMTTRPTKMNGGVRPVPLRSIFAATQPRRAIPSTWLHLLSTIFFRISFALTSISPYSMRSDVTFMQKDAHGKFKFGWKRLTFQARWYVGKSMSPAIDIFGRVYTDDNTGVCQKNSYVALSPYLYLF